MAVYGNAHRVHDFPVAFWRGDQPDFSHQRVTSHTRAGANAVGRTLVGRWGRRFTAELELHAATYNAALAVVPTLMELTGRGPVNVIYNRRPLWLAPYRHLFLITDVRLQHTRAMPRILGPNYNYAGGAAVVVSVEFEPFPLF